ncbi:putative peroxidase, family 2 [Lyophyllum shimeji]|uniref:Peroxidase, family 2 n=1 Tax=Lyophyllum shimeji TaxID=47721 RepID=A0A9P3UN31_LYOSH|nr:putative peroxidase, family 2 [Lyophyllum shimeji]
MLLPAIYVVFAVSLPTLAFPELALRDRDHEGVRIVAPPRPTDTGVIPLPEPGHPFIPPRRGDQRGPCPGLNTLANHGYLPRNGIASFEQIVSAVTRGFNMDYDLASGLTAFGMLARGNPYINKLSIGLDTPLIPPLPGKIDGPITRGLAAHGRFEGDVSMTRQDFAIGDNIHFQRELFAQLLDLVAQYGDNSTVTGPRSVVNRRVMEEFKFKRFVDSQAADKKLEYHIGRVLLSYGEAAFTLNFFANGTDGILSTSTMTSFFRDQRFPKGFYRRSAAGNLDKIGEDAGAILSAKPVPPGANAPNGTYIPDTDNFDGCSLYYNLAADNVPAVLLNTTGVLKQNVDFLLNSIHVLFSDCPPAVPRGAAGV